MAANQPPPYIVPLQYFDSRHPDREAQGPDKGWIDFTETKGACRDAGHTHYAWVNDHIWDHWSYIHTLNLLCTLKAIKLASYK
jgi:hypothetical protein